MIDPVIQAKDAQWLELVGRAVGHDHHQAPAAERQQPENGNEGFHSSGDFRSTSLGRIERLTRLLGRRDFGRGQFRRVDLRVD